MRFQITNWAYFIRTMPETRTGVKKTARRPHLAYRASPADSARCRRSSHGPGWFSRARPQRMPIAYPASPPASVASIETTSTPPKSSWPWLARTAAPAITAPPMAGTPAHPIATSRKTARYAHAPPMVAEPSASGCSTASAAGVAGCPRPPPGMPPQVVPVGGDPGRDRVRSADPLKLQWDIAVVQVGMVTAIAADDLEHAGVAALRLARHDAGGLAPQDNRPAKARCPHGAHECHASSGPNDDLRLQIAHHPPRVGGDLQVGSRPPFA